MTDLLKKEFRLVIHPTTIMFFALSALLMVPNYPYYVTFYYTTLGVFFSCLSARENNDIFYTMTLPVRKTDIVKAKYLFIVIIELLQFILAIPFCFLRNSFKAVPNNEVGMEANIAFFGISLFMMGLFNLYYLIPYFKAPKKVGKIFGISSTIFFVIMMVFEVLVHCVPFMKDKLDTKDPQFLTEKIIVLVVGAVLFAVFTAISYSVSSKKFEKLDI